MKLTNINNNNALELAIEDYCNHIEDERIRENTKWRFIMRSERLDFLCARCGIRVNAYIVEYSSVLANYDHLLPLALTCSDENIDLVRIIGKYANSVMKYIKKYENESGNLTCVIIEKGRKQYFIDFKQKTNGGVSEGSDNEGTITEDNSRTVD